MADEDLLDDSSTEEHPIDKRIKTLSDKVKSTAEERDEKDRLLKESQIEKDNLIKERDFLNSFGDQVAKFPDAAGFKDKIKERFSKGYSLEDATAAVLVAEGKYQPPRVQQPVETVAGGSAPTIHQIGDKTLDQLSQAERRAKLVEAESRGDFTVN